MKQETSLVTRNFADLTNPTGNIYEATMVIAKRARQIVMNTKEELDNKLIDFITATDSLEEVFENKEQIEISKEYEKMPKPTTVAVEKFLEGEVMHRYPDSDATQEV